MQRTAQVEALRAIYADGRAHAEKGSITDTSGGPFHTHLRPASTIITGDFNLEPVDPLHARMKAPFADGTVPLLDAWEALNPGVAHPSTFCIYMKMEPGGPELHCDFYFVSADLKPRLKSIRVDQQTQASDHQPVIIELGWPIHSAPRFAMTARRAAQTHRPATALSARASRGVTATRSTSESSLAARFPRSGGRAPRPFGDGLVALLYVGGAARLRSDKLPAQIFDELGFELLASGVRA